MSHKVVGFPEKVQKCNMHPYSPDFFSPGTCYIRNTSSAGYLGPSELKIHQIQARKL